MRTAAARPQVITALPVPVNLDLYAGDDFTMEIAVAYPDGTPYPVDTAGPASQVREGFNGDVIAEFTIETDEGEPGLMYLSLAPHVTAGLPRSAVWDVQISPGGSVITLAAGTVTVTPEVTR